MDESVNAPSRALHCRGGHGDGDTDQREQGADSDGEQLALHDDHPSC
jgi:hypothetical protein